MRSDFTRSPSRRIRLFLCGGIGWVVLGLAPAAAQEENRAPVPDAAAQKEALKTIREVFKDEYARRSPRDAVSLALKLLGRADEAKGDLASLYVLLCEARDLALQGGNVGVAMDAIDEMARNFAADPLTLKSSALATASQSARTPEELSTLVGEYLKLADEAADRGSFDPAEKALSSAASMARRAKDIPLIERVGAKSREVSTLRVKAEVLKKAQGSLAANPDDPPSNTVVGKFLCAMKADWDAGLPLLAKGADPDLKALAATDLARPGDPKEQVALGDGWWNVGDKESDRAKDNLQGRAAHWYERALPQLTGLGRAKVEKRLSDLRIRRITRGSWIDVTDPELFGVPGKKGEPLCMAGEQGFGMSASMRSFPAGDYDGFSVQAKFDPVRRGHARVHFEDNKWIILVDADANKFRVLYMKESNKPATELNVPCPVRDQYVFTVLMDKGTHVLYLDGEEKGRIKAAQKRLTSLMVWAVKTTVVFDQIRLRRKGSSSS